MDNEKSMIFSYIDSFNWSKLTLNIILGYGISWLYFIVTASIFTRIFGKVQGYTINYVISWLIWIVAIKYLYILFPNGNQSIV